MRIPACVIILTKNEETALPACIQAVTDFTDIFVVDSESDDNTVRVAESLGAHVITFRWNGQYPKKKQWALENVPAKYDWILLLDADEIVSPDLVDELRQLLDSESLIKGQVGALDVTLQYEWQGGILRHGHKVVKRSFLHRERCTFPVFDDLDVKTMWEVEGHYQPQTAYNVKRARGSIIHRDPDPIYQWFARHNRYSDWEAYLRVRKNALVTRKNRSHQGRWFAQIPGKPIAFFVYSFFFRRGFLDGRRGLDYALAQAFYYWQIDLKSRELARNNV